MTKLIVLAAVTAMVWTSYAALVGSIQVPSVQVPLPSTQFYEWSDPAPTATTAPAPEQGPPAEPPAVEPTATVVLTPVAAPANRADCNAIRGTDYLSGAERDWFLANCAGVLNRADCDAIRGTDYLSADERNWYLAYCL